MKIKIESALEMAEQWKGRADDAGRLSRAVLASTTSATRRLLERCIVLLISQILTEPMTNARQRVERGRLIRAIKRVVGVKK